MMLSLIRGLLGTRHQTPSERPAAAVACPPPVGDAKLPGGDGEPIVLSFRFAIADLSSKTANSETMNGETGKRALVDRRRPTRRRPLTLRAAGIGSAGQRRALRSLAIRTTSDLLAADPADLAARLGLRPGVAATFRRWQRAIRLSRRLPTMTPLDALLMRAVHRGTLQRIAAESPSRLHRDLQRYAISTAGARLLSERPIPSAEQVKQWVEAARRRVQTAPRR